MKTELRHALRRWRKAPGFYAVVLGTLALGIGVNTAIFSIVYGALIRPLPYPHPDRLVELWSTERGSPFNAVPGPTFQAWQKQAKTLDQVSVENPLRWNLREPNGTEPIRGLEVSPAFLRVLGVEPIMGRGFVPADAIHGHDRLVTIISWAWWQAQFDGDRNIVGRSLALNGRAYTVIGVLPPKVLPERGVNFLVPITVDDQTWRQSVDDPWASVIARLKPGVTLAQADADLAVVTARHYVVEPPKEQRYGAVALSLQKELSYGMRSAFLILACAAGVLLLIVCANVAALMLVRVRSRGKEIALRAALGAAPGRIVREVLTESVALALLGGALGVAAAAFSVRVLGHAMSAYLPSMLEPRIDPGVLAFSVVTACGTGLLFGAVPALRVRRTDLNRALKETSRSQTGGRLGSQMALVTAEVTLTLMLLIGGGLLLRSLWRVLAVAPGFDPRQALTGEVTFTAGTYRGIPGRIGFMKDLVRGIEGIPGVQKAGIMTEVPFDGVAWGGNIRRAGDADPHDNIDTEENYVAGHAFAALGIRILKGRAFRSADNEPKAQPVCILNERLARKLMPGENPVGRYVRLNEISWRIVGVAADARTARLDRSAWPCFYAPQVHAPWSTLLVIRTTLPVASLVGPIHRLVQRIDPNQSLAHLRPLESLVVASLRERKLTLVLVMLFAGFAICLAAVGVYGLMAYTVTQRARELSIRTALGARGADNLKLMLRDGLRPVLFGIVLGVLGALAGARILGHQLYEVKIGDPGVYIVTVLLLAVVATLSILGPAMRSLRANPVDVLREE